jgi:HSP20 family protein
MAKQNGSKQRKTNTSKILDPKNLLDSKAIEKQAEDVADAGSRLAATPFQFMKRFGEEMDRLFGDFGFSNGWLPPAIERGLGQGVWSPQVEMFERNGQLVVRADLPGLKRDEVNAELADDAITIEGERRSEKNENEPGFYRSERSYGKFYRRLPLPEGVKVENANATFNNGVLEITMDAPKPKTAKSRKLNIRDESEPKAKAKAA